MRGSAWEQGPPRWCWHADTNERTQSGEKWSGEKGAVAGLKDPNWLTKQLAELFEQNEEHEKIAKQPKQIVAKKKGTETLRVKQKQGQEPRGSVAGGKQKAQSKRKRQRSRSCVRCGGSWRWITMIKKGEARHHSQGRVS